MTLLRRLCCLLWPESEGDFVVKTLKFWWFHKLFRTKKYRSVKMLEKIIAAKQEIIMKDFREQHLNSILYGTPICMNYLWKKD